MSLPDDGPAPGPVLVTGANGVLTSAVAQALAGRGRSVLLHVHRSTHRLERAGLPVGPAVRADLRTDEGVRRLAAAARKAAPLGGLVLGASAFVRTPPTASPPSRVREVIHLELAVQLELVHGLHGAIRDGGRILLFSDAGVRLGWPSYDAYLAAKAGLEAAARSLARALGPRLVVFCLAPGLVEGAAPAPAGVGPERLCLHRVATPDEVAEAAVRAWDLPAAVLQGAVLHVDGGWLSPV